MIKNLFKQMLLGKDDIFSIIKKEKKTRVLKVSDRDMSWNTMYEINLWISNCQ